MPKEFIVAKVKGKEYKIPKEELNKLIAYGMTKKESIETWLADNDIIVNEEEKALTEKAKAYKRENAKAENSSATPKKSTPKTVKVSDEKKELFATLVNALSNYNATIEKENKLIIVKSGEKIFKIDLIEQRPPKK